MPKKPANPFANSFKRFIEALKFPAPGVKRTATDDGMRPFGELMAPHQREWVETLDPLLLAVAKGETPKLKGCAFFATKGAAKDTVLALACIWLIAFARRPITGQVGAADRDQGDELHKAARLWIHWNPWLADRVKATNYRLSCEETQSEVEIIASDIAGSHGSRPDLLILNEVTHVTKWEFVQNLMDNATKVPNGLTIIASNSGFKGSDAHKLYLMAKGSPTRWAFHEFNRPAPWLLQADLDEAEARNSRSRFLRLFWGVWVAGAGDAIEEADIEACIRRDLSFHTQRLPGWQYVSGLDLGIRRDHSALVTLGRPPKSNIPVLVNAQSWAPIKLAGGKVRDIDLDQVEEAVWLEHKRFGIKSCQFDPHQAIHLASRLSKKNIPMKEVPFIGANLHLMASCLIQCFREHAVLLYDEPKLIRDLHRLTIEEKSYGMRLTSTRDADGHADTATAFALALPAIKALPISSGGQWDGVVNATVQGRVNSMSANRSSHEAIYGKYGGLPQIHWPK